MRVLIVGEGMDRHVGIDAGIKQQRSYGDIARKIFLCYPTKIFEGREELQFEILDEVARHFDVPITSVQVAGSAKTGYSYLKGRKFEPRSSDLDLAVIDQRVFSRFVEEACRVTRGYSDLTPFPRSSPDVVPAFLDYVAKKGIIRLDYMPKCELKEKLQTHLRRMSNAYFELFQDINVMIYLSLFFFESKQRSVISNYARGVGHV